MQVRLLTVLPAVVVVVFLPVVSLPVVFLPAGKSYLPACISQSILTVAFLDVPYSKLDPAVSTLYRDLAFCEYQFLITSSYYY